VFELDPSNAWTPVTPLLDEHDNRHSLGGEPKSREAAIYLLHLPEERLGGFVYTWVHANGMAGSAAWLFGPGVQEPITERLPEVLVPPEMDFYDWRVNGLTLRLGEPHKSVHLAFESSRLSIDYTFEATHPAYAYSSHKDGCPSYYADDRTEQHGRIKGTLLLDGRQIPFDTFGQRDHSWGTRIWGLNQHYKWFHATVCGCAVHFFEMQSFGKVLLRGYVFKDGRMAQVTAVNYDYSFDQDMLHTSIDVMVTDSIGRSTFVKSICYAHLPYDVDPMNVNNEAVTTVEIDGKLGVGYCEFCWNKQYLEFARRYVSRFYENKKSKPRDLWPKTDNLTTT
jgi:hypothetical protein